MGYENIRNATRIERETEPITMSFHLPSNITAQRKPINATTYAYILHHSELGQLGQILLSACVTGRCNVTSLVHGHPGDQMMERRRVVFEPLARTFAEQIQLEKNLS